MDIQHPLDDEEIRRRASKIINSNSGISGRTLGWMYMITEPVGADVVEKVKEAELARFEAAKKVYFTYQNVKQKTGMSLRSYCFCLYTYDDCRSWNYYKNLYTIYRHFMIYSKMDPEQLIGISFKQLRFISETGPKIFTPLETREIISDLKKMYSSPMQQWQRLKEIKNYLKRQMKREMSKLQREWERYRESRTLR